MSLKKTPGWVHMMDEIAIHPDPIAWTTVGGLRMRPADVFNAVQILLQRGYIERAGVIREQWMETTWKLTRKGRRYWEAHVRGKRKRPPSADPVPRFSTAHFAVAHGPRGAFDLARVTYLWDQRAEARALGVPQ